MTPEGAAPPALKPRRDETLIKALVRAHRCTRPVKTAVAVGNGQAAGSC
jgi:hypothetical protein